MSETPWEAAGTASRVLGAYVTAGPEVFSGLLALGRPHRKHATPILNVSFFVILNATASCWFYGNISFLSAFVL